MILHTGSSKWRCCMVILQWYGPSDDHLKDTLERKKKKFLSIGVSHEQSQSFTSSRSRAVAVPRASVLGAGRQTEFVHFACNSNVVSIVPIRISEIATRNVEYEGEPRGNFKGQVNYNWEEDKFWRLHKSTICTLALKRTRTITKFKNRSYWSTLGIAWLAAPVEKKKTKRLNYNMKYKIMPDDKKVTWKTNYKLKQQCSYPSCIITCIMRFR